MRCCRIFVGIEAYGQKLITEEKKETDELSANYEQYKNFCWYLYGLGFIVAIVGKLYGLDSGDSNPTPGVDN